MEAALAAPRTETHDTDAHLATRTVVAANELTRRYGTGRQPSTRFAVSLEIPRGHLTAVMGPSGSGKSTLMHILAGLDKPSSGTGRDRRRRHHRPQGQRPHEAPPAPHRLRLPVLQPAADAVGRGEHHPAAVDRGHGPREWLEELLTATGLENRRSHRPAELSGGQQQRVAVARALVSRPTVLRRRGRRATSTPRRRPRSSGSSVGPSARTARPR